MSRLLQLNGRRPGRAGAPTVSGFAALPDFISLLKPGASLVARSTMHNGLIADFGLHNFSILGGETPPIFSTDPFGTVNPYDQGTGAIDNDLARYVYHRGAQGGGVSDSDRTYRYLLSDDGVEGHAPHRHEIIYIIAARLLPSVDYAPDPSVAGALFEWPPSNGHKVFFSIESDGGAQSAYHWLHMTKETANGNQFRLQAQQEPSGGVPPAAVSDGNQVPADGSVGGETRTLVSIGQWYAAGFRMKQSTDGDAPSADGEYVLYVSTFDGASWSAPALNLNRRNLNTYGVARGCSWSEINLLMEWGGGGVQTALWTERQIDHVEIWQ